MMQLRLKVALAYLFQLQSLNQKIATLESEKAEWEREKNNFLLEINKLKLGKNDLIAEYESFDKKDDVRTLLTSV